MERMLSALKDAFHKPTREEIAAMNKRKRWDAEWRLLSLDTDCAKFYVSDVAGKHLLELCCGSAFRSGLAEEAADYVGIDVSRRALKDANGLHENASFVCAEAEHLPFIDDSFEKVVAIQSASLIGRTLPEALREAARVTKGEVSFDIDHVEVQFQYGAKLLEKLAYGSILVNAHGERISLSEEDLSPLLDRSNLDPKEIRVLTCNDEIEMGVCDCCDPEEPKTKSNILITATRKR
jgi:SAM-dependent methyltransferase